MQTQSDVTDCPDPLSPARGIALAVVLSLVLCSLFAAALVLS